MLQLLGIEYDLLKFIFYIGSVDGNGNVLKIINSL